jgi:hypothetical protein
MSDKSGVDFSITPHDNFAGRRRVRSGVASGSAVAGTHDDGTGPSTAVYTAGDTGGGWSPPPVLLACCKNCGQYALAAIAVN